MVNTIECCVGAADGRKAIRCKRAVSTTRSLSSSSRREEAHFEIQNSKPKSKRAFSLRLLQASSAVAVSIRTCIPTLDPTPIPPARGACFSRQLAGSPPGRGQGWVDSSSLRLRGAPKRRFGATAAGRGQGWVSCHSSFHTCSPAMKLRQQDFLRKWCRRFAGYVACSAGVGTPAELFFDLS